MVDIFVEGRRLDVFEGLDFSFNYSIADIREPDKRSTEYTKTIKCPATQNNDELFGHIYDFNIGNAYDSVLPNLEVNFNPNKKASVDVSHDGIRVMKGSIQLRRIVKKKSDYVYEVVFVGQLINIFSVLSDKTVGGRDVNGDYHIDFSDLNHYLNKDVQQDSWVAPIGEGYVYPMVDWGRNLNYDPDGLRRYWASDLRTALYTKEIVDRVFEFSGFSYTSTFFDSDFFKRLIIPCTKLRVDPSKINEKLFSAARGLGVVQDLNRHAGAGGEFVGNEGDLQSGGSVRMCFDVDSPQPFPYSATPQLFDNGTQTSYGNYYIPPTANGIDIDDYAWRVHPNNAGVYQLRATTTIRAKEEGNNSFIAANEYPLTIGGFFRVMRVRDGVTTLVSQTPFIFDVGGDTNTNIAKGYEVTAQVTAYEDDLYFSEIYCPYDEGLGFSDIYYKRHPQATPQISPAYWLIFEAYGGRFHNSYLDSGLEGGEYVDINTNLPDVGMSDLLLSLVKMFNLYITPNPDKDNDLIIETYNDFYSGGITKDWTHKLDHSKDVIVQPLALLTANEYEYTYSEDGDYYNDRYQDTHNHVHGRRKLYVDNDFITRQHKTEVVFSPSPLVNDSDSNRLVPKVYDSDIEEGVKQVDSNVRILYYAGLLTSTPAWIHSQIDQSSDYLGSYPYAGHWTHPLTPAQDIHFGLPLELFYTENANTGPISITTNNLYNTFHSQYIREVTDKDSKMLTAQFYLDPIDIHKLDFRDQIVIDNSIWRINKIENFNPFNESVTKVELIKVIYKEPLEVESVAVNGGGNVGGEKYPTISTKKMNNNSFPPFQGKVRGRDNVVHPSANNFEINGDGNQIESGANNIVIRGHNNIVREGVTNVTLINTNGVTVTHSGATYVNNRGQEGADLVDGGLNEVRSLFSEVPIFTIDGGEDEVNEQYSESAIYLIDGGID